MPYPLVQAHCGTAADVRGVLQRGRREGILAAAPGRLGRVRPHRRHAPRPRALGRQRQPHGNHRLAVTQLNLIFKVFVHWFSLGLL